MQVRVQEDPEEFGRCGCGRSPTGKCIGLHTLSEQAWAEQKVQILANIAMGRGKIGIEKPTGEPGDEVD
jgi:hypothetical protein